jgi:hypothetical protein
MDRLFGEGGEAFEGSAAAEQALGKLVDAATEVQVRGETEREERSGVEQVRTGESSVGLQASSKEFKGEVRVRVGGSGKTAEEERILRKGTELCRVHFGANSRALAQLTAALPGGRLWLLLDEWSAIPMDLQPVLADLLRRCVFPITGLTVKIAAIEHRSSFKVDVPDGGYIGIEVGADASADLDLDDFMVFGNDREKSEEFFGQLVYRHLRQQLDVTDQSESDPGGVDGLVAQAFTGHAAFQELVRAAEGVPRDALNVLYQAALNANDEKISVPIIRGAAGRWYSRDKRTAVESNVEAVELLHWIIDEVIGHRRARAFLLRQGEVPGYHLIRYLYDARVLHVLRRGSSAQDRAGERFDVYGLDYGCYVDLINTVRQPQGLLPFDGDDDDIQYLEVPQDDFRSIRRAILDIGQFLRSRN